MCPCWRKSVTVEVCFEVFYAQAIPRVPQSLCWLWIKMWNSCLVQHQVCLHAAILSAMTVMNQTSETVRQPQWNVPSWVAVVMVSPHSNEPLTKTLTDLCFTASKRSLQEWDYFLPFVKSRNWSVYFNKRFWKTTLTILYFYIMNLTCSHSSLFCLKPFSFPRIPSPIFMSFSLYLGLIV